MPHEKFRRFEEQVSPLPQSAYNLAEWLTRSREDAEDIVQEAFLKALSAFERFRSEDAKPWLLAIVRNTAMTGSSEWTQPLDKVQKNPVRAVTITASQNGLVAEPAAPELSDVFTGDSSLAVDEERCGQRFAAAVHPCDGAVTKHDTVVHVLPEERLDRPPTIVIHGHAQHGEAPVLVDILELDEPGNLDFAGTAPRRPKIEQHHFALEIGKPQEGAVRIPEAEIRGGLPLLGKA
jgi:hypothetical protein